MKEFYFIWGIITSLWILNLILKKHKTENKKLVEKKDEFESLEFENTYNLPYLKKKYLLTIAEKNFYEVLKLAIEGSGYYICPKVRVADLLYVNTRITNRFQFHFNKIVGKHIDFVLCNEYTMTPIIAIELDDRSHDRKDRVERDIFINQAFKSADLRLVRFKVGGSYSLTEIKNTLGIE